MLTAEELRTKYADFLAKQDGIYAKASLFMGTQGPLTRNTALPFYQANLIAWGYGQHVASAVQDYTAKLQGLAQMVLYDGYAAHTTIFDHAQAREPGVFDRTSIGVLGDVFEDVYFSGFPVPTFNFGRPIVTGDGNAILIPGTPTIDFVDTAHRFVQAALGRGINVKPPVMAHITLARFTAEAPFTPELLAALVAMDPIGPTKPKHLKLSQFTLTDESFKIDSDLRYEV